MRLMVIDERDACQMTARMLEQATCLRRAAAILDQTCNTTAKNEDREDFLAAFRGAPILRAQSAEIALKALWCIGHGGARGKPPRRHNLTELHDALTETIQERLAREFEIRHPSWSQLPPVRPGLRTILTDHDAALMNWRYAHEHDSPRFENVFDEVLDTLIDIGGALHELWRQRLLEGTEWFVRRRVVGSFRRGVPDDPGVRAALKCNGRSGCGSRWADRRDCESLHVWCGSEILTRGWRRDHSATSPWKSTISS